MSRLVSKTKFFGGSNVLMFHIPASLSSSIEWEEESHNCPGEQWINTSLFEYLHARAKHCQILREKDSQTLTSGVAEATTTPRSCCCTENCAISMGELAWFTWSYKMESKPKRKEQKKTVVNSIVHQGYQNWIGWTVNWDFSRSGFWIRLPRQLNRSKIVKPADFLQKPWTGWFGQTDRFYCHFYKMPKILNFTLNPVGPLLPPFL